VIVADDTDRLRKDDGTPVNRRVQHDLSQNFTMCSVSAATDLKRAGLLGKVVRLLVFCITFKYQPTRIRVETLQAHLNTTQITALLRGDLSL